MESEIVKPYQVYLRKEEIDAVKEKTNQKKSHIALQVAIKEFLKFKPNCEAAVV